MTVDIFWGDARDLARTLADGSVKCVIADPPYGMNFRSGRGTTPAALAVNQAIANDQDLTGAINLFHEVMQKLLPKFCADEAELYVFTRWDIVGAWIDAVKDIGSGFDYKMLLVWDKGMLGMGDLEGNWGGGHELILYVKRGRRPLKRRSSVIHVERLAAMKNAHPTEKPVGLMEVLIEMSTSLGDLVVDPFAGSGSTLLAAKRLERRAVGFELEAKYADAIQRRLLQEVLQFG